MTIFAGFKLIIDNKAADQIMELLQSHVDMTWDRSFIQRMG